MCLAIPMKIKRINDEETALAEQGNSELEVNISLVEGVKVGDYVIVHAGFAIEVLENEDAEERLEMFRRIQDQADVSR
ncbi:MAG: HypC/HybG/HupF family hydrogenase formation chaperone [Spirochaetes bacterium]|nr:MAG: HypC/HybG/HupF family hydrogenase formation chaperone [Spirochaetota bacterium]